MTLCKRKYIRTYTGTDIDIACPPKEIASQILIEDVAHHLALMVRYNGGCPFLYSVAQHSMLVAELAPSPLRLAALLHDAAEAYTGDLVSPLKHQLQDFRYVESIINEAIAIRFGFTLSPEDAAEVAKADKIVEAAEMMQLLGWADIATKKICCAPPRLNIYEKPWQMVKAEFLALYYSLGGTKDALAPTNHLVSALS